MPVNLPDNEFLNPAYPPAPEVMEGEAQPGYRPPRRETKGQPVEFERKPAPERPTFDFDEAKLRRLLREADDARTMRRDAGERRREARAGLSHIKATCRAVESDRGELSADLQGRLRAAEQSAADADAHVIEVNERTAAIVALAPKLEEWARSQGWRPDGSIGARASAPVPAPADNARFT